MNPPEYQKSAQMKDSILAWHFVGDKLRNGDPVPKDGEKLVHVGEIELCRSGLHASRLLINALGCAPGNTICRVKCSQCVIEQSDKLACRERTILWRIQGKDTLKYFARMQALSVLYLWNPPDVVKQYLNTGDELIRESAHRKVRHRARFAENSAAYSATYSAVHSMNYVEHSAAYHAARCAARAAARSAAYYVEYSVADFVPEYYAPESYAAYNAAYNAVWTVANETLTKLVFEAHKVKIS